MGVSWAMNLLMYCSLPKKALISFSVFGTGMPIIALAFAGRLRFLFCWQWTRVAYLTKHQTSSRLYMLLRMKTKTVFPQSVKHFLQIHGLLQPKTWRSCHRHRPPFPCESYHETAQSWLAGRSPRHSLDQTASPCNRTCPPIWYGDKRRFLSVSVFLGHLDLVISRESIHKGQHPMSSGVVHQNIDVRKRKIIFLAC